MVSGSGGGGGDINMTACFPKPTIFPHRCKFWWSRGYVLTRNRELKLEWTVDLHTIPSSRIESVHWVNFLASCRQLLEVSARGWNLGIFKLPFKGLYDNEKKLNELHIFPFEIGGSYTKSTGKYIGITSITSITISFIPLKENVKQSTGKTQSIFLIVAVKV